MPKAMRCSTCGISYPPEYTHCLVPACQDVLWAQFVDGPDDDWQAQVAERAGIPVIYSAAHPPDGRCEVRELRGYLFVKHEDLIKLGYTYLESGSVIRINETFCELSAYSENTGYWWIEPIETEGAADELRPEMFERWNDQDD